jgi:hypothetical protein
MPRRSGQSLFSQDTVLSKGLAAKHFQMVLQVLSRKECPEVWHTVNLYLSLVYRTLDPEILPDQHELANKHYALAFNFDKNLFPILFNSLQSVNDLYERRAALRAEIKSFEKLG